MQNFIIEFKQAFTPEYCNSLIEKFEKSKHKQEGRTGAGVDKSKKDSVDLYISKLPEWQQDCNNIAQTILKATVQYAKVYPFILTGAISPSILDPKTNKPRTITHEDVTQMGDEQVENLVKTIYRLDDVNLQRYTKGKGGYHHWHSEHYPHPSDQQQKSLHRVLLWLIYLNDVDKGGETEFFYQQAKVKPTQGSLILAPCTFTHTHRGSIPESNDKYVLASWLMYANAGELYAPPPKH
ncbi:2OG-Fe(II) oxygenase [Aliikangiella sp. G2MR2-5]|uniref:2OG-Fe(II) oxygenase n=1 Tax=Aliikangiella sp. G2MR2-5 TaxID=2788943 RepID=UPI0018AAC2A0|nr:2OG-Fe(II) oxygenase [Aliikangiella sp. G2MR2-5]